MYITFAKIENKITVTFFEEELAAQKDEHFTKFFLRSFEPGCRHQASDQLIHPITCEIAATRYFTFGPEYRYFPALQSISNLNRWLSIDVLLTAIFLRCSADSYEVLNGLGAYLFMRGIWHLSKLPYGVTFPAWDSVTMASSKVTIYKRSENHIWLGARVVLEPPPVLYGRMMGKHAQTIQTIQDIYRQEWVWFEIISERPTSPYQPNNDADTHPVADHASA